MLIFLLFISTFGISQGLQRPLVIGHRGTAYLPELTLASQSMAHAYGADIIEIDVCLSQDDQLIVIHGKYDIYLNIIFFCFSSFYRYLFGWSDKC
jgi:glycerophosphoryl diester phosphodiesterase